MSESSENLLAFDGAIFSGARLLKPLQHLVFIFGDQTGASHVSGFAETRFINLADLGFLFNAVDTSLTNACEFSNFFLGDLFLPELLHHVTLQLGIHLDWPLIELMVFIMLRKWLSYLPDFPAGELSD